MIVERYGPGKRKGQQTYAKESFAETKKEFYCCDSKG